MQLFVTFYIYLKGISTLWLIFSLLVFMEVFVKGVTSNMQCCLTGVSCSVVKQYIFAIVVLVVVVDKVIN